MSTTLVETTQQALTVAPKKKATRGTSNKSVSGNSRDRAARKNWLLDTWRAEVDVANDDVPRSTIGTTISRLMQGRLEYNRNHLTFTLVAPLDQGQKACRCYRCGVLLTYVTLTVDRIVPGCKGGKYVRNNIRPACGKCNSETGGALASGKEHQAKKRAIRRRAVVKAVEGRRP